MADYLESYAAHFDLPVRSGVRVDRLSKEEADSLWSRPATRRCKSRQVVIAMSKYQKPWIPDFAGELDPAIVQFHSLDYRNPGQLRAGSVLLVGAGNSAAEIARDLTPRHKVFLSGRHPGHVPFRIEGRVARNVVIPILFQVVFHRVLTVDTPMGRKARAGAKSQGAPLIRIKPKDLYAEGVERMPRLDGTKNGRPLTADGRSLDVDNLIWCTGFRPGLEWVDLPIFDDDGHALHRRGVTPEPGLYIIGLGFLYAYSSMMIQGLGRDAAYVATRVTERIGAGMRA